MIPSSNGPAYWRETHRPLVNLVFVVPLLLLYEAGTVLSAGLSTWGRNGADEWLRIALAEVGWSWHWGPPAILIGVLLGWQFWRRDPWKVRVDTLAGMAAESLLFACLLILAGQCADFGMRAQVSSPMQFDIGTTSEISQRFVHFLGAGLYEELLFRLCLMPAVYLGCRALLVPHRWSIGVAIVTTSVLFALAHYLHPNSAGFAQDGTLLSLFAEAAVRVQSSQALWFGFGFRLAAGVLFALVFWCRGFGIAVGCHAVYDIVVGIVLVSEL